MDTATLEEHLRELYLQRADRAVVAPLEFTDLANHAANRTAQVRLTMQPIPGDRRSRTWVTAACGLAVAATIALLIVARGNPDYTPSGQSAGSGSGGSEGTAPGFPFREPGWLPDGYALTGANDVTGGDGAHSTLYADLNGVGHAIVIVTRTAPIVVDGDHLEVAGRDATGRASGRNYTLETTAANGIGIEVTGTGYTADEVATIAAGIATRSDNPADGAELTRPPLGLVLISETAGSDSRITQLVYSTAGPGSSEIQISAITGTADGVSGYLALIGGDQAPTRIDGIAAYKVTDARDDSVALIWETGQGIIEVRGVVENTDDMTRVAESLRAIDADTWTALIAQVGAQPRGPELEPTATTTAAGNSTGSCAPSVPQTPATNAVGSTTPSSTAVVGCG